MKASLTSSLDAVETLEDEEKQTVEEHIKLCEVCDKSNRDLQSHLKRVTVLNIAPSPAVWTRIESQMESFGPGEA